MMRLEDILGTVPDQHRVALSWFSSHYGSEQSWPTEVNTIRGPILLATKAKGIYKPRWTKYALSVRENLGSLYKDREPTYRPNGTWSYLYFQENVDLTERDKQYTNRGLMECLRDRVPVGVFRQTKEAPSPLYRILGVALVVDWKLGHFVLEGFNRNGLAYDAGERSEMLRAK